MVLENQVAIVTGGGKGIGKAIAVRCTSEGANIAVFDVNAATAEAGTREIGDLGRRAQTRLWTDRERVAVPAKRDSGAPHRRIPAEGEGKIVKFRASFSED